MDQQDEISHSPEPRVRLVFFLPCRGVKPEQAAKAVLNHLRSDATKPEWIGGLTHSPYVDPVFEGVFWGKMRDGAEQILIPDGVMMVIIDCQHDPEKNKQFSISKWTSDLAEFIHAAYKECPQDEVWITVHRIQVHRAIRKKRESPGTTMEESSPATVDATKPKRGHE